jgi:Ca-activated chloride channel family protein
VPYGLSICIEIQGKEEIASIESPSHSIIQKFDSGSVKVEFSAGSVRMNKDFILNINYRSEFQKRGYIYKTNGDVFIQVDIEPAWGEPPVSGSGFNLPRKEVIFLLDCSGSMDGNSITEAKKALEIFLKGLKEGIRFNVYAFGSRYKKLFSPSVEYNNETLRRALEYLKRLNADMGGTEVLSPLMEIYGKEAPTGYMREIILITDGQVGNEQEVLQLVKNGNGARLFPVGIGYGPNEYFIRQMARSAGGASEMIAPGERVEPKILRLFKKVMAQPLEDFKISWGADAEQAPLKPIIFSGEAQSIFARLKGSGPLPENVTVSMKVEKDIKEWKIGLKEVYGQDAPIPILWSRETIGDLEESASEFDLSGSKQVGRKDKKIRERIIDISRTFHILSRETSFIAIEEREERDKASGEPVFIKIPVLLTEEWGGVQHSLSRVGFFADRRAQSPQYSYSIRNDLSSPIRRRELRGRDRGVDMDFLQPAADLPLPLGQLARLDEAYDDIVKLLSMQMAEGGFRIDRQSAKMFGSTITDLKKIAQRLETREDTDKFLLLSTALVLSLLMKRFAHMRDVWSGVIDKSIKWFEDETSRTDPRIDGVLLKDWANRTISDAEKKTAKKT